MRPAIYQGHWYLIFALPIGYLVTCVLLIKSNTSSLGYWQIYLPAGNRGYGNKWIRREEPNFLTESPLQAVQGYKTLFALKYFKILEEKTIFVPFVSFVCL